MFLRQTFDGLSYLVHMLEHAKKHLSWILLLVRLHGGDRGVSESKHMCGAIYCFLV